MQAARLLTGILALGIVAACGDDVSILRDKPAGTGTTSVSAGGSGGTAPSVGAGGEGATAGTGGAGGASTSSASSSAEASVASSVASSAASGGGSCEAPSILCGAECVNVQTNPEHCGACDKACPKPKEGMAACVKGECLLPPSFVGPAANTAAPNGVTVSVACTSGLAVDLAGDFLGGKKSVGCDKGSATARLVFTPGDGTKTVTVTQMGSGESRAFTRKSNAPVPAWVDVPGSSNSCGVSEAHTDPNQRRTVIVRSSPMAGVLASNDGGTNFTPAGKAAFDGGVLGPWEDPYQAGTFYALTHTVYPKLNSLYKSTDGGMTWLKTGAPPAQGLYECANGFDFGRLTVDASHRLYLGIPKGYATSDDDGKTWSIKTYPQLTSKFVTHVSPLPDASKIWIGTDNLGVFVTTDNGATLGADPTLALLLPPYKSCAFKDQQAGVLVSPFNPRHLIASAGWQDGKVLRSTDGGQSWKHVGPALALAGGYGMSFSTGVSVAFEPGDIDTFWIKSYVRDCSSNGIEVTHDGGATFTLVPGSNPNGYATTVGRAVDAGGNEFLFQGDNCGAEKRLSIAVF